MDGFTEGTMYSVAASQPAAAATHRSEEAEEAEERAIWVVSVLYYFFVAKAVC